jgi:hypothetical protein
LTLSINRAADSEKKRELGASTIPITLM